MKGTPLASTATLMNLTSFAKNILPTSFKQIEVFIVDGSTFFCLIFFFQYLVKTAENELKFNV